MTGHGTAALDALEKDIQDVVGQLKTTTTDDGEDSEVLLIVDQPDFLLAATGSSKGIGTTEMNEWIMGLQQVCTVVQHVSFLSSAAQCSAKTDRLARIPMQPSWPLPRTPR